VKFFLNYLSVILLITLNLSIQAAPIGCPSTVDANGNVSFEEPLPAGGSSWLGSSPFWSGVQNGNSFDMTPYLLPR